MKKIYIILIVLMGISISCTKNFEEFNTDTKKPTEVPGNFLFANAQKALADQVASTNVNLNIFKLISQYWTETTYTDEANYDIVNRNIPDNTYRTYYRDILEDFSQAKIIISGEVVAGDEATIAKSNRLYIIDLLMAYCYQREVDIFGDIPYSQALDINNISPAYDDAATIYSEMISSVQNAVAELDEEGGSFGSDDIYYGGDVEMWKKFGYSLLVKLGITLAEYDFNLAKSTIEGAYSNAFTPDELCELVYLGGGSANSNPLWVDLVQSGRHDFVPANTIVDMMNDLEDPRRHVYFEINVAANGDEYVGGDYGYSNIFTQYSHIGHEIEEPTFPITLLDGTEVAFYLAEAAEHGMAVGGTAEEHYNNAIMSSFQHWGLTEDAAKAYLAKPEVAYSTASSSWQETIGTQAYLAYYIRGLVGWNSWRRLDYPILNLPPSPATENGQVPLRFTYPVNEQTLNAASLNAAIDAMGGTDLMSTPLFWDIN
jgi:hypothetical protein